MTRMDPMEQMIVDALDDVGEPYIHEGAAARNLDFYLPRLDVYIEVKQMHSPRISDQMSRADNILVAQGASAVRILAHLLRSLPKEITDGE